MGSGQAYGSSGEGLATATAEAGGVVRKQLGKKFSSGHVVKEPVLSMSMGKPSPLLVAPADPTWEHVPLPNGWL